MSFISYACSYRTKTFKIFRWKMYIWHITSYILSSIYQKLLKLMEISRSSDRNSLCSFFWDTVYIHNYIRWLVCDLYRGVSTALDPDSMDILCLCLNLETFFSYRKCIEVNALNLHFCFFLGVGEIAYQIEA